MAFLRTLQPVYTGSVIDHFRNESGLRRSNDAVRAFNREVGFA
jgi:hypothetical protein